MSIFSIIIVFPNLFFSKLFFQAHHHRKDYPGNFEKFRMGKITTNPKSIESRERKAENAAAKKAAILKAKEDASWEDNDKQLARKADRANAAVSFFIFWTSNFGPCLGLHPQHLASVIYGPSYCYIQIKNPKYPQNYYTMNYIPYEIWVIFLSCFKNS